VVTAAALIMFFVFFAFVPEGSGSIKPIALGLAVGIAFDAFLVRMTLVPAIMTLLGRAAWWMPKWLGRLLPDMDIEGEKLREHQDAVAWARGQGAAAISADSLLLGTAEHPVGPLSLSVPGGALVLVRGELSDRRLAAATLAGRLDPVSGLAQLGGHPLPSDAGKVARLVAMAELGGFERSDTQVTLGELLTERLQLTQPWYRAFFVQRRVRRLVDALAAAMPEAGFSEYSRPQQLQQPQRAVALALVAIAERTPVVMLDQLDQFASAADESAFITAICALADRDTTIVLGTPAPLRADAATGGRPVLPVDLHSLSSSREVLR
jgi:RND superfamily putative drug exporter